MPSAIAGLWMAALGLAIVAVVAALLLTGGCTTADFVVPEIVTGDDQVAIEDDMAEPDLTPRCCANMVLSCFRLGCPYP